MMSAVTTASSVSGCRTIRRTTTMPRTIAITMVPNPMNRPSVCARSLISALEHQQPRGEDPRGGEARIDQRRRIDVRRNLRRDEDLPGQNREHDAGHDADQPRREERAKDAHRWRDAAAHDER